MPDLSPLPFGTPQPRTRLTRQAPRPTLQGPGVQAQVQRLGPAFSRLSAAFQSGRVLATTRPAAVAEQVLVFQVAGELDNFAKALARVPGLEFLAEAALERVESGTEFSAVDSDGKVHRYDRQLYAVFSDQAAWQQLLALWAKYQAGQDLGYGKAPFKHLFARLEVLRAWDDTDRLSHTGALETWERELVDMPDVLVDFEVELWLRSDPRARAQAVADLQEDIVAAGGEVVVESVRPDISYHGVLARVPAGRLLEVTSSKTVRWLRSSHVRFFHAQGQIASVATSETSQELAGLADAVAARPKPGSGSPKIAVLDGVPVSRHASLDGRLIVDDPDEWEATSAVASRVHGTAMSSLVVHGDLNGPGAALTGPVYLRPILLDQSPDWVSGVGREELPRDRLAVDILHAAVARLYEGDTPAAPDVKVIVLAVGDEACQFDRFVSPLARLLDWLQAKYNVLCLISAGNHPAELELPKATDLAGAHELQHAVLCAIQQTAGLRRLLSPAESINALTVGAGHEDAASERDDDGRIEPMSTPDLPNACSPVGIGVRGSVKPEILLPGGRQLLTLEPRTADEEPHRLSIVSTQRPPGVRVAAPGRRAGVLDATAYTTGTSPATAIAGHHAGSILEELAALRVQHGDVMPGEAYDAVLTKAALTHTASWGSAKSFIEAAATEIGLVPPRVAGTRILGYGRASPSVALRCDTYRATVLAAADLGKDQSHAYKFPLPPSLAAQTERRRLTLTLAWLSPINPDHRAYRRAALVVEPINLPQQFVERDDVDQRGARRGTIQHEVHSGRRAVPYAPGDAIELLVSCRADAGDLLTQVRYGLMVTIEVPENSRLPIYQEVEVGLRVPVAVPRVRT